MIDICCFTKCISDFWVSGEGWFQFQICFKKAQLHFTTCIWQSKIYKSTTYWGKENRTGIATCCCWFGWCYSFIVKGLYSCLFPLNLIQSSVNINTFSSNQDGYRDILKMADNFSSFNQRLRYAHLRPSLPVKSDPRAWWKYAYKVVTQEMKKSRYSVHSSPISYSYMDRGGNGLRSMSNIEESS